MAWGRMDDGFDDHPKVLALLEHDDGVTAVGLWTLTWTWAHRNTRKKGKVPGRVPAGLVRRFLGPGGKLIAGLLVEVGLWEVAEDGWQIHDFDEYLPDAETRAARSEAGKKGAAKRWASKRTEADDSEMPGAKQPDGTLPSDDDNLPSASHEADSKHIANDGSRAHAHREWAGVGSSASDRTSVSVGQDQPPPSAAAAFGDGEPGRRVDDDDQHGDGKILDLVAAKQAKTPELGSDQDAGFVEFWHVYPRKRGKPSARRAWAKAVSKARASPEAIIAAARRFAADPRRRSRDIEFTAHPATWLNDARYDDAPEEDQEPLGWDDVQEQAPKEFNW